jgi:PAS domain S-box-containing protein
VFTLTFGIYCWLHAGALKSLYPKEDFIIEQEKRRLLLAKLQACDETMPLARFESRHGQIIWANRTAQELLGYSLQQLHRLPAGSLCHPDDRERVLRNALEQSGVPYECRIVTATDRVVHVEVRTTNDPSDTALRISFLTDVTRYVEERDRRIREYNSYQSLKNRRSAEDGLLADLVEGSNNF